MEILKGAEVLLTTCSNCGKDEKIAIVTDPTSYEAAKALYDAAKDFKNKSLLLMDERNMHGQEPTDLVAAAMLEADVIFGATKFSLFHSNARRKAVEAGARFVNMADYDVDMLKSGGLFADFEKSAKLVQRLQKSWKARKLVL